MDDIIEVGIRVKDNTYRTLYKFNLKNAYDKDMLRLIEAYCKFRGNGLYNLLLQKFRINDDWV